MSAPVKKWILPLFTWESEKVENALPQGSLQDHHLTGMLYCKCISLRKFASKQLKQTLCHKKSVSLHQSNVRSSIAYIQINH